MQIWASARIRRRSWQTFLPSAGRPSLAWAFRRLGPPPTSATSAPQTIALALADDKQKMVVAIESDDEDTCTDLVFKRQRVGEVVCLLLLRPGGPRPLGITLRATPPHATLLFTKVGGRAPLKAQRWLPPPSSPRYFNKSSNASRIRRCCRA